MAQRIGPETLLLSNKLDEIKKVISGSREDAVPWVATDSHTPSSDRSLTTSRHQITVDGTLSTAFVEIVSGSPRRQVYCRCFLETTERIIKAILFRGYVDTSAEPRGHGGIPVKSGDQIRFDSYGSVASIILRLRGSLLRGVYAPSGWTGTDEASTSGRGAPRIITGTNPAAGAEASDSAPTGARWLLRSYAITLVTTAGSTPRMIFLLRSSGSDSVQITMGAAQGAGETRTYLGFPNAPRETAYIENRMLFPFPPDRFLPAGDTILTSSGLNANDNYGSPLISVEEWIEA